MVDVEGVTPEGVLFSAASGEAYADTPAERVALIVSWVRSKDATTAEVVGAIDQADGYLDEDSLDAEAARALVVLRRVLTVLLLEGGV